MEKGVAWPQKLGNALARSCVLVPLWSKQYFNSPWCNAELAYVHAREIKCGFRTPERPEGLIVPTIIHDGDDLPDEARILNPLNLQKYANIRVAKNSPTLEELSNLIQNWVPDVASAIGRAPAYDNGWLKLAVNEFIDLFKVPQQRQRTLPTLDEV
jgi:TIR domain